MEEIALVMVVVTILLHVVSLYVKAKKPVGLFSFIMSVATVSIWLDGMAEPYSMTDIGVVCVLVYITLMSVVLLVTNPTHD